MQRRTILNLALGAALILLTAKAALACFWDRDTLAQEAAGLPGVVEVLLGRIDRWPPEYYAMRLERVTKQLESEPDNLALYDDAAVASDRLKRFDEAIEWMARKRAVLDTLPANSAERKEHEYRYLANLGTHHAHRWIADGGSAADLTDLERAIELIRAAIDLNPDAHFGREKVQLGFLEALRYTRTSRVDEIRIPVGVFVTERSTPQALAERFGDSTEARDDSSLVQYAPWAYRCCPELRFMGSDVVLPADEAIEGLIGLMTLGDAWASVDAHESLATAIMAHRHRLVVGHLAASRSAELSANGARSIINPNRDPKASLWLAGATSSMVSHAGGVDRYFDQTRPLVDQINSDRMAFIQNRLAQGIHPDTHSDFWDGYRQSDIPDPPGRWALVKVRLSIIAFGVLFFAPFVLMATFRWRAHKPWSMSAWLIAGAILVGGPMSLLLTLGPRIVPSDPGDFERWESYEAFQTAMQSNQP